MSVTLTLSSWENPLFRLPTRNKGSSNNPTDTNTTTDDDAIVGDFSDDPTESQMLHYDDEVSGKLGVPYAVLTPPQRTVPWKISCGRKTVKTKLKKRNSMNSMTKEKLSTP